MGEENVIEKAIEMEAKIRDIYSHAHDSCKDQAGRRFFAMMRDDEQYHMDYLSQRLQEWRDSGQIQSVDIEPSVPSAEQIKDQLEGLKKTMAVADRGVIQQMLGNALQVEVQTSEFYEKMIEETDGITQKMFAQFLEIENAHVAAVQAELDYVMHTGYWFDVKEFDME